MYVLKDKKNQTTKYVCGQNLSVNTILLKDKYVGEYEPLSDSEVLYYLTNKVYVLVIIFLLMQ